jgi:glycosyltransferase involved in cell wall biosynthesis
VRLLYVVDRFPAVSETFVLHELAELCRQGEDVRIVSRRPADPRDPVHPGTAPLVERTLTLPRSSRPLAAAAVRLLVRSPRRAAPALVWCIRGRVVEREAVRVFGEAAYVLPRVGSFDHAHAHFAHGSASLAQVLGRLHDRPYSFTAHARDVLLARPRMLTRKLARCAFAVAPSEFIASRLRGLADESSRVVVVRNGVPKDEDGHEPGPKEEPPLVLSVARLVPKKGLDLALRAAALLAERRVEARWEFVGDGPLRGELASLAERLGLDGRVVFSGSRDHAWVRRRLRAATLFVLPARVTADGDSDALPAAIVEALAAGVPVVTTDVGGIGEVVVDGVSGRLVRPDDAEAVADAVEELLRDDALRERLAAAAPGATLEYDLAASAERLRDLFRAAAR